MKILIAAVLSVALIWLHPQHTPVHLNNSVVKTPTVKTVPAVANENKPTPQAQPTVQPTTTAVPAQQTTVAKQVTPTYTSGCSTYDSLFRQYAWNVSVAEAICMAESGGNPYALSQTQDRGLMQINSIHADMVQGNLSELYTPATNIAVAWKIYSANGWDAWSTYLNGGYSRYL